MVGEYELQKKTPTAGFRRPLGEVVDIDRTAELLGLAGNATRLKLLYRLAGEGEHGIVDLAEVLEVSVSTAAQHLAKLKAKGLVAPRRIGHKISYRLTQHPFNSTLHEILKVPMPKAPRSSVPATPLEKLHDPKSGRLDAARIAGYLKIPLKQLASALGKKYSTVHRTPAAPSLEPALRPIKRSLDILEEVLGDRAAILAWWNHEHSDLGRRTPMEVLLAGYPEAIRDMLEGALAGIPS